MALYMLNQRIMDIRKILLLSPEHTEADRLLLYETLVELQEVKEDAEDVWKIERLALQKMLRANSMYEWTREMDAALEEDWGLAHHRRMSMRVVDLLHRSERVLPGR